MRQVSSKPFLFRLAHTMDNTRRENLRRLIRDAFGDSRARFYKLTKMSKGRLSQLLDPEQRFGELAAKNLVKRLGLDSGFFERDLSGDPNETITTSPTPQKGESTRMRGGVAHLPILPAATVTPSHTWGDIVPADLPAAFSVELPDDSMAPDLPRGTVITFATATAAESGDGILLTDKDGSLYFRQYRARTATAWQAVAKNPAYLPLDSAADGLTLVAIVTNVNKAGSKI